MQSTVTSVNRPLKKGFWANLVADVIYAWRRHQVRKAREHLSYLEAEHHRLWVEVETMRQCFSPTRMTESQERRITRRMEVLEAAAEKAADVRARLEVLLNRTTRR